MDVIIQLQEYFKGKRKTFDLDIGGTEFRKLYRYSRKAY